MKSFMASQRAQLEKAAEEAAQLLQREASEENLKAAEKAADALESFDERAKSAETLSARMSKLMSDADEGDDNDAPVADEVKDDGGATLGERYIKSPAYKDFQRKNPTGVGAGSIVSLDRVKIGSMSEYFAGRKAEGNVIGSPAAHVAPVRYPTVDTTVRRPLALLDLVSRGRAEGNFEYVQITNVTNNAAIVAEATSGADGLKPTSDFSTEKVDAKTFTYADGYTVTNDLLADAPAMASFMDTQLQYNLHEVIEDKLLNGTGRSGEPTGIMHTTGVQEVQAASAEGMALIEAVRKGKTKLRKVGALTQAIIMNPEDHEKIDLLKDGNQRFYGNGPFGLGPETLWGTPIVESELVDPGHILMGDFKQVALLDREGLSITAFNQHKDYAQRNLVYVRAELRAIQAVWRPDFLLHITQGV